MRPEPVGRCFKALPLLEIGIRLYGLQKKQKQPECMLNEHVAPAVFCMCSKKNGSVCMGHRTKRILRIERKEYQTY